MLTCRGAPKLPKIVSYHCCMEIRSAKISYPKSNSLKTFDWSNGQNVDACTYGYHFNMKWNEALLIYFKDLPKHVVLRINWKTGRLCLQIFYEVKPLGPTAPP